MRSIVKHLGLGLIAAGVAAWSLSPLHAPAQAHASGTCAVIQSLSSDIPAINGLATGADVIAAFNHARQAEGCSVPLSISASAYDAASPQQQMLMLFNAERTDRNLNALSLDSTLLSQIDLNHSREMATYNYFNHPSPINQPGNVFARDTVNPAVNGHWSYLGENIAAGYTPGGAVYAYMYTDSGSGWGHRHNILGTFNWVGIGVYQGGSYGHYYSSDFLNGSYSPPASADTTAPSLSAPAIISGSPGSTVTAEVTGVSDSGAASGEAGLTGVVFSAGAPTLSSTGTPNTVSATQTSPGVWSATLSLPAGATLHAVAVDGSGNFTDCTASSSNCPGATTSPPPTSSPPPSSNPPPSNTGTSISLGRSSGKVGSTVTITGSGFSPNETVDIYWDGAYRTYTTASSTGTISRSITVPQSTYGLHTVKAVGYSSGNSGQASFSVLPTLSLSRGSAIHGTYMYAYGYGFSVGETVTLHIGSATGTQLGSAHTTSTVGSSGAIGFYTPALPVNTYTLYLVGTTHTATASFAITG